MSRIIHDSLDEVNRRAGFYNTPEAAKYLKKHGVPKSNREMKALIATLYPDASPDVVESIGYVYFRVHPQQINIVDKANQKLIVLIEK